MSPDVAAALARISEGIKAAVEWSASFPLSLSDAGLLAPDREAAESVYEQTRSLDLDLALVAQALSEARALRQALELPLMFHAGGPWDDDKRARWKAITGTEEATTRIMCNSIRSVLGMPNERPAGRAGAP